MRNIDVDVHVWKALHVVAQAVTSTPSKRAIHAKWRRTGAMACLRKPPLVLLVPTILIGTILACSLFFSGQRSQLKQNDDKNPSMAAGVEYNAPQDYIAITAEPDMTTWPLWWFAPFFDRTSFGKEAATLMLGLGRSGAMPIENIWVGTSQGDCNYGIDTSMPRPDFDFLDAAKKRADPRASAIVVCHSLPPFWARPKNKWETCAPCPPVGYTAAVAVGRAMAETDIYHFEFVKYCNRMDEVWVPSQFSYDVLNTSGVDASKLRIVPIAVNTTLYNPEMVKAVMLPYGELVFGKAKRTLPPLPVSQSGLWGPGYTQQVGFLLCLFAHLLIEPTKSLLCPSSIRLLLWLPLSMFLLQGPTTAKRSLSEAVETDEVAASMQSLHPSNNASSSSSLLRDLKQVGRRLEQLFGLWSADSGDATSAEHKPGGRGRVLSAQSAAAHARRRAKKPFTFVSTFKWEMRKGWDVLLSAYLQEFTSDDNVEMYILTKPFMAGGNFSGDMRTWAFQHLGLSQEHNKKLPTLYVLSTHLSSRQYAGLYKAADAYVTATRGEGWGMPITEAMSMGLPVVVTNWSGVTAFVDESVGYMVDYTLEEVPDDQPWWFLGAKWAVASTSHLRQRMREVMSDRRTAAAKGKRARQRMVKLYSPEAVGRLIAAEHERLTQLLRSGTCKHCNNKQWVAPPGDTSLDLYTGQEPFLAKMKGLSAKAAAKFTGATSSNIITDNNDLQKALRGSADSMDAWHAIIKVGCQSLPLPPKGGTVTIIDALEPDEGAIKDTPSYSDALEVLVEDGGLGNPDQSDNDDDQGATLHQVQADMEQLQAAQQELQSENESLEQQIEEHTHALQLLQRDQRQLFLALRNVRRCRPRGPWLTRHQRQLMNILMRHRVSPEVLQRTAAYLAQHYLSTARLVLQTQVSRRKLAMCR
ncbi:hypothetical protein QJQ45_022145 [Haematococcus lacustris]|nr:hypothetical protein QJQ45_022145 [Haematococcus lacustris]